VNLASSVFKLRLSQAPCDHQHRREFSGRSRLSKRRPFQCDSAWYCRRL